jgi:hypothetical protein
MVKYASSSAGAIVAVDLDGDGKPDLAVTNTGDNTVRVLINQGNGTFTAALDQPTGSVPWALAVVDLNGDGRTDLAVANEESNNVSVLLTSCVP